MGGYMGVAAKEDCVFDLYFGIDYHSHLGTRRGGVREHAGHDPRRLRDQRTDGYLHGDAY